MFWTVSHYIAPSFEEVCLRLAAMGEARGWNNMCGVSVSYWIITNCLAGLHLYVALVGLQGLVLFLHDLLVWQGQVSISSVR